MALGAHGRHKWRACPADWQGVVPRDGLDGGRRPCVRRGWIDVGGHERRWQEVRQGGFQKGGLKKFKLARNMKIIKT